MRKYVTLFLVLTIILSLVRCKDSVHLTNSIKIEPEDTPEEIIMGTVIGYKSIDRFPMATSNKILSA